MAFKFWEMLKNASEVTLVQKKKKKFLAFFEYVQSFVKFKVSLADGTSLQSSAAGNRLMDDNAHFTYFR